MAEGAVEIPNGIECIGDGAFSPLKKVTSVSIPASLKQIGSEVFSETYALNHIDVSAENTTFSAVDGVLFNNNQSVLYTYPASKNGKLIQFLLQ